jgi:hypothetical protein
MAKWMAERVRVARGTRPRGAAAARDSDRRVRRPADTEANFFHLNGTGFPTLGLVRQRDPLVGRPGSDISAGLGPANLRRRQSFHRESRATSRPV